MNFYFLFSSITEEEVVESMLVLRVGNVKEQYKMERETRLYFQDQGGSSVGKKLTRVGSSNHINAGCNPSTVEAETGTNWLSILTKLLCSGFK